jgi:hypothetical protein
MLYMFLLSICVTSSLCVLTRSLSVWPAGCSASAKSAPNPAQSLRKFQDNEAVRVCAGVYDGYRCIVRSYKGNGKVGAHVGMECVYLPLSCTDIVVGSIPFA